MNNEIMGNRKEYLINNIVKVCTKLDQKGFGANHDGNVSVRFDSYLLATPTAVSKGDVSSELIITLDMDGKKIDGIGKPFSEIKLHLAAYHARADAKAVVHAHPPYATARGLAGKDLIPELPEAIVSLGNIIPVAKYTTPGAACHDEITANALAIADVFMMQGNGVLAIGDDLEQAYLRLELVEHIAKIDFYAGQMGSHFTLPECERLALLEKRTAAGLGPEARGISASPKLNLQATDSIKDLIAEEIRRVLQNS